MVLLTTMVTLNIAVKTFDSAAIYTPCGVPNGSTCPVPKACCADVKGVVLYSVPAPCPDEQLNVDSGSSKIFCLCTVGVLLVAQLCENMCVARELHERTKRWFWEMEKKLGDWLSGPHRIPCFRFASKTERY